MLIKALGRQIREKRTRSAIRKIRLTMLEFGFDLSPFSDAEIIEASDNFAELTIKADPASTSREAMMGYLRSVAAQTDCYNSIGYLHSEKLRLLASARSNT